VSPPVHPSPADLEALARRDPALGEVMPLLPPYPGFPRPDGPGSHFHALARTILYQQLAGKAAATIHARVTALTPGPRFPTPAEILAFPEEVLRGAGVSRAKVAALRGLAEAAEGGDLPIRRLGQLPEEEVMERLTALRGIGPWSARMFLLFRLGRLDVLAPDDLGIREGLRRLEGAEERPTPAEVERRGEVWRPLRSVASWYLWRLSETTL